MNEIPGRLANISGPDYPSREEAEGAPASSPGLWQGRGVTIEPLLVGDSDPLAEEVSHALGKRYGTYVQKKVAGNLAPDKAISQRRVKKIDDRARKLLHQVRRNNTRNIEKWLKSDLTARQFEKLSGYDWRSVSEHERRHMEQGVRAELMQSRKHLDRKQADQLVARYLGRHRSLFSHTAPRVASLLARYGDTAPPVLSGYLRDWGEARYQPGKPPGKGRLGRKDLALIRNMEHYSHKTGVLLNGSPLERLSKQSFDEQIRVAEQQIQDIEELAGNVEKHAQVLPAALKKAMLEDLRTQMKEVKAQIHLLEVTRNNNPMSRRNWKRFKVDELAIAMGVVVAERKALTRKGQVEKLGVRGQRKLKQLNRLEQELKEHIGLVRRGVDHDIPPGLIRSEKDLARFQSQAVHDGKSYTRALQKRLAQNGVYFDDYGRLQKAKGQLIRSHKKSKTLRTAWMSNLPWRNIDKDLSVRIDGRVRDYHSRMTPAGRLRLHLAGKRGRVDIFPTSYEGKGRPSTATREKHHAANLWETELTGKKKGRKTQLFKGVRSATLSAYGLSDPNERKQANLEKAREVWLSAARIALERQPDCLDSDQSLSVMLSSESMLTADLARHITHIHDDELTMQEEQEEALELVAKELESGKPLEIVDSQGQKHLLRVAPELATLNHGVNKISLAPVKQKLAGAWRHAERKNQENLEKIMGSTTPGEPVGGWVGRFLKGKVSKHEREIVLTLVEQIRDLHSTRDYRKEGEDAYKMVERVLLLSYRIGAIPYFNCKSGKDRTGEADAGTKRLAAEIEALGYVPDPRQPVSQEEKVLSQAFLYGSGNIELQQKNINLPGYKTKTGKARIGEVVYIMSRHPRA